MSQYITNLISYESGWYTLRKHALTHSTRVEIGWINSTLHLNEHWNHGTGAFFALGRINTIYIGFSERLPCSCLEVFRSHAAVLMNFYSHSQYKQLGCYGNIAKPLKRFNDFGRATKTYTQGNWSFQYSIQVEKWSFDRMQLEIISKTENYMEGIMANNVE